MKQEIVVVAGARPNFVKIAPILREIAQRGVFSSRLVHTGQHYDEPMSQAFFDQLGIAAPAVNLRVGSGSHACQTADVMRGLDPVLETGQWVLLVGDVNSTLAAALVAAKKGIPVAHVEAGLRSFDRSMPEEINRVVVDRISDWLFTTETSAQQNLLREGVEADRIHFAGNVMIDSLLHHLDKAPSFQDVLARYGAPRDARAPVVMTLHRPSNVDQQETLERVAAQIERVAEHVQVYFSVHPRTRARIGEFGLEARFRQASISMLPPLPYLEMLGLMRSCRMVITDSGGIQEEAVALKLHCLTMRDNTERPITVASGSNRLVGRGGARLAEGVLEVLESAPRIRVPEGWDGRAAVRIHDVLERAL